jgi:hypothetical protein
MVIPDPWCVARSAKRISCCLSTPRLCPAHIVPNRVLQQTKASADLLISTTTSPLEDPSEHYEDPERHPGTGERTLYHSITAHPAFRAFSVEVRTPHVIPAPTSLYARHRSSVSVSSSHSHHPGPRCPML